MGLGRSRCEFGVLTRDRDFAPIKVKKVLTPDRKSLLFKEKAKALAVANADFAPPFALHQDMSAN